MSDNSQLYAEAYRPQFHFSPRQNWMNDPNGLVYYRGEYHLFFQHNPFGIQWGNMTWGHAISSDLVHWEQFDHALLPDRLGTMFSGSAVVDWDNTTGFQTGAEKPLVAIYTAAGGTSPESSGQPFTQCLAFSLDRGRTWTKYAGNPVLAHVRSENRDPKVIWHAPSARWIMALFLDDNDFAFFASPDLKTWTHLHDITVPGCRECPDFFDLPVADDPIERKWVFTGANGRYLVGDFDGWRFTPESGPHIGDWGANYYAVQTYSDMPASDDRRIQIAWMAKGEYPDMPFNQQMSFPGVLTLRRTPDGLRLYRQPVGEIETLRGPRHAWGDLALRPGENPLAGLSGELFEINAEIELAEAAEVGFRLRGEAVRYDVPAATLSYLGCTAPLASGAASDRIQMRILLDRTTIEIFGNAGAVAMSSCFVPSPENRALEVYAIGGAARIVLLEVYELRSAWKKPN